MPWSGGKEDFRPDLSHKAHQGHGHAVHIDFPCQDEVALAFHLQGDGRTALALRGERTLQEETFLQKLSHDLGNGGRGKL
jgi:hypothetical protein